MRKTKTSKKSKTKRSVKTKTAAKAKAPKKAKLQMKKMAKKSSKKTVPKKAIKKAVKAFKKTKTKTKTVAKATKPLAARGVILSEGTSAPDFELNSHTGESVRLSNLKGQKVVLFFYPKDMTPGCTQEVCDFQRELPRFENDNVLVLGVSRDGVKSHQKFAEKHGLSFKLLADEDGKVSTLYGVLKEKNMYGKKSIGIERTTFVIDQDGMIRKVFNRVQVNGHVDELLSQLTAADHGAHGASDQESVSGLTQAEESDGEYTETENS